MKNRNTIILMAAMFLGLIMMIFSGCNYLPEDQDAYYPYGDETVNHGYCGITDLDMYNQMCKELGVDTIDMTLIPESYISQKGTYWEVGSTIHVHFVMTNRTNREYYDRGVIHEKAQYARTARQYNIKYKFTEGTLEDSVAPTADVRHGFENTGAWAFLGTVHRHPSLGRRITQNTGWLQPRTSIHENDHTLGMYHSHQSKDCPPRDTAYTLDLYRRTQGWTDASIFSNVISRQLNADGGGCDCDKQSYPVTLKETFGVWECNPPDGYTASEDRFRDDHYPFKNDPVIITPPITNDCEELQAELDKAKSDLAKKRTALNKIKSLLVNYQSGGEKTKDVENLIQSLYTECGL